MRERFHLPPDPQDHGHRDCWPGRALAFGAIYQIGSWSQDASRAIAGTARTISDLNKQLSIEMLEARRNEKEFPTAPQ